MIKRCYLFIITVLMILAAIAGCQHKEWPRQEANADDTARFLYYRYGTMQQIHFALHKETRHDSLTLTYIQPDGKPYERFIFPSNWDSLSGKILYKFLIGFNLKDSIPQRAEDGSTYYSKPRLLYDTLKVIEVFDQLDSDSAKRKLFVACLVNPAKDGEMGFIFSSNGRLLYKINCFWRGYTKALSPQDGKEELSDEAYVDVLIRNRLIRCTEAMGR